MKREPLTREQVVAATVEIFDAEGIEALSMRKLGQKLGSAATSMYWHVGNKQNLIVLATDKAWSEIKLPDIESDGWRGAAFTLASRTYEVLTRHHWIASAITTYYAFGPSMARFQEHSLAIYEAAGFEGIDLAWVYNTVFGFILGAASSERCGAEIEARLEHPEDGETAFANYLRSVQELVGAFPGLKASIDLQRSMDRKTAWSESFNYGINTILDGLQARLDR